MDGPRFDVLTRTLVVSRRVTLASLLGGALLGIGRGHNAAADC